MKKIKLLLMSLMIVALAACGGDKEPAPADATGKDMVEVTEEKMQEVDEKATEMIDETADKATEMKDEAMDKVDGMVDMTDEGEKADKVVEKEADEAMDKVHEEENKQ